MWNNNQVILPFLVHNVYFAFMLFVYILLIYTLAFLPVCLAPIDTCFGLFKDECCILK